MKQIYLKTLVLLLLCVAGTNVLAYDCIVNGIYYNLNKTEKTAEVTYLYYLSSNNKNAYSSTVTIPSTVTYNGITYTVTSIGEYAFYYCSRLMNITIPGSVTDIGNYAFKNCSGLTNVTIPESMTNIGYHAFEGTAWYNNQPDGLVYIGKCLYKYKGTMPENTSVNIKEGIIQICFDAFNDCSGLTSITIPESVTNIGSSAFSGCTSLRSIIIPKGVTFIGYRTFDGCSGLTSITIPDGVTSIWKDAFDGCSGLQKVIVPNIAAWCKISFDSSNANPLSYAHHLFSDENTEITNLVIPEGVTNIGDYAFEGCSGLKSITIPESVTSIGGRAFNHCSGLTSITIPESVTSIGDYVFMDCSGLTSISIPNSVTSIGSSAFEGCTSLTSIKINTPKVLNWFAGISEIKEVMLGDQVTTIGKGAFQRCTGLTSITIPESVTSIGSGAFSGCTSLTSITIPESVTSIGGDAFSGCTSLTSITIPESVTSIGSSAFMGCTSLTSITISESVTSIGGGAFSGCTSLTSITIPESVTSIGSSAFSGCSGLKSITIPEGVTSIGQYAFDGCSGLQKVIVPDIAAWCKISFDSSNANPLSYAHHLFSDENTEITNLVIPEGVTNIGDYAFEGCSGLKSITIPENVTSIGWCAFSGCSGLTNITIPNSVTSIGKDAFYGCDNLKEVSIDCSSISDCFRESKIETLVIGNHTEIIGDSAFCECSKLKKVTMGSGIKSVGFDAFEGCNNIQEVHVNDLAAWCNIDFETIKYNQYYTNYNISYYSNPLSPYLIGSGILTGGGNGRPLFCNGEKVTDLVIPDGVKIIKPYVFAYGNFQKVTIPSSITQIYENAFYKCTNLNGVYINDISAWCDIDFITYSTYSTIWSRSSQEANPLKYARNLYLNEKILTNLSIPPSVKQIKPYAFYNCSLESIVLPNGFTTIGESAFSSCQNLKSIVIPNSVTNIGGSAFSDCMNLYSVTSLINIPFNLDETVFQYTGTQYDKDIVYMAAKLYVPIGRTAMYSNVQGWKKFMSIMETDTKFKLTYMVDGEVYKTYEIQAAEVITPEPDPYKEGYIFSGWSEIPYLMPAQDITVTGSFTIDPEYQVSVDILKKEDTVPEAYYSPEGRRLDAPQRGINIIRMSNGTTKKVFVK